jgi:hypothetical protein
MSTYTVSYRTPAGGFGDAQVHAENRDRAAARLLELVPHAEIMWVA